MRAWEMRIKKKPCGLGFHLLLRNFLFRGLCRRVNALNVGDVNGTFFFLEATVLILLSRLDGLLDHTDALNEDAALGRLHFKHSALGTFGGTGDDDNSVAFFDVGVDSAHDITALQGQGRRSS